MLTARNVDIGIFITPARMIAGIANTSDIFAKIGDIKGESTDSKHKDEIEVLSFSWGVTNAVPAGGAGGGAFGTNTVGSGTSGQGYAGGSGNAAQDGGGRVLQQGSRSLQRVRPQRVPGQAALRNAAAAGRE